MIRANMIYTSGRYRKCKNVQYIFSNMNLNILNISLILFLIKPIIYVGISYMVAKVHNKTLCYLVVLPIR